MSKNLRNRGPDYAGYWCSESEQIALVHRRLAILDLSPSGKQPMQSSSGKYIIAYNGEIYNHLSLRKEIEKSFRINWRGKSDTETLLACFDHWGIKKTLEKSVGMFAIALWNRSEKTLTLARDRIGEKPLYYGWQNQTFLFGSTSKSLTFHPSFEKEINLHSLYLYLQYGYVPSPKCIWIGLRKVEPGTFLRVSLLKPDPLIETYWSLESIIKNRSNYKEKISYIEAKKEIKTRISTSVKEKMISDVPIGVFLSGGIDSSTVAAIMQSLSNKSINTFSIGSTNKEFDEAPHAKKIASYLNTNHHELYISQSDALNVISKIPLIYDEPFADSSQIPTYLVSELAKKDVTVALSGDGGDEIFGGYNRYLYTLLNWKIISTIPKSLRILISCLLEKVPNHFWNNLYKKLSFIVPQSKKLAQFSDKVDKIAKAIKSDTINDLYNHLTTNQSYKLQLVNKIKNDFNIYNEILQTLKSVSFTEYMMALDTLNYLPNDILTKVDRASMAVSLETRAPFLDHRILEFAWSLPLEYKINKGISKAILRDLAYDYIPKRFLEQPKMGFGIPLGKWLRDDLKNWSESLLFSKNKYLSYIFDPYYIKTIWSEHFNNKKDHQNLLWRILMFKTWEIENFK